MSESSPGNVVENDVMNDFMMGHTSLLFSMLRPVITNLPQAG
jgi:hypothetical protein